MKLRIALGVLIAAGLFAWLDGFNAIQFVIDNWVSGKTAATIKGM